MTPSHKLQILFTGASSFSGMWFVEELARAGHHVTAIFQGPLSDYSGTRRRRIERILPQCTPIFQTTFGDSRFLDLISAQNRWDLLCHHAADVTNYKSPDFNVSLALAKNSNNLKSTLLSLKERGCNKILLTGSVFEQNEGKGGDGLRAVSPYGLSKGLTSEMFAYYTTILKMKLGKFVIPNPFGPYEEGRFTTYLIQKWLSNQTAAVNTPLYIRDNVPISLLALSYAHFANQLSEAPGFEKFSPSCYVESQGDFTKRFAHEMGLRLNLPCHFECHRQNNFDEPMARFNTDALDWQKYGKTEAHAWDELAHYYQSTFGKGL